MKNADAADPEHHQASAVTTDAQVAKLKEAIWNRRPILGEIMRKHGETYLHRYAQDFLDVNPCPILDERKEELISTAAELLSRRLGPEVAEAVARQLRKLPLVSTTDHHGPIDHPFFVNANIISGLPFIDYEDPLSRYLVVFSFASVSVNNASAYPRGILFHGRTDRADSLVRLPILPDKLKMGVVYGTRAFTRIDLDRAQADLQKKERAGEVAPERAAAVSALLERYFGRPDVLDAPDLAAQITKINYELWPKLFHRRRPVVSVEHLPSSLTVPDLVYLEIETLVTELLLKRHLKDPASPFYQLMFDGTFTGLALKYFNNLAGAFSVENDWGTYMFWGVDEKRRRVRLKLEGDRLVSPDGSIEYALTPQDIRRLLEEKKIFPSMLLSYLMVALYYGMKCLGGFSQVHDLTVIKDAWTQFLEDVGDNRQAEALHPLQTKELGGDGMVLSYLTTSDGHVVPSTGVDMVLDTADTSFETFVRRSKNVTLREMMYPMFPEMYTVLYSIQDRNPELTGVTPEGIMESTGLTEKIRANAWNLTPAAAPSAQLTEPEKIIRVEADAMVPVEKT